jgi:hypothetical protein
VAQGRIYVVHSPRQFIDYYFLFIETKANWNVIPWVCNMNYAYLVADRDAILLPRIEFAICCAQAQAVCWFFYFFIETQANWNVIPWVCNMNYAYLVADRDAMLLPRIELDPLLSGITWQKLMEVYVSTNLWQCSWVDAECKERPARNIHGYFFICIFHYRKQTLCRASRTLGKQTRTLGTNTLGKQPNGDGGFCNLFFFRCCISLPQKPPGK